MACVQSSDIGMSSVCMSYVQTFVCLMCGLIIDTVLAKSAQVASFIFLPISQCFRRAEPSGSETLRLRHVCIPILKTMIITSLNCLVEWIDVYAIGKR